MSNGLGYLPALSLAKTKLLCEDIKLWVASNIPVTCWAHSLCADRPLSCFLLGSVFSGLPCMPSLPCWLAQLPCPQGRVYNPTLLSHHFTLLLFWVCISHAHIHHWFTLSAHLLRWSLCCYSALHCLSCHLVVREPAKPCSLRFLFCTFLPLFSQKWLCLRPAKGKREFLACLVHSNTNMVQWVSSQLSPSFPELAAATGLSRHLWEILSCVFLVLWDSVHGMTTITT